MMKSGKLSIFQVLPGFETFCDVLSFVGFLGLGEFLNGTFLSDVGCFECICLGGFHRVRVKFC